MIQKAFKIATLVFIENSNGDQLLLHRRQSPNKGLWTPIGGKLDVEIGESPVECAIRETKEEAGFEISAQDLHQFGYLSEKSYEGEAHWLIFLFHCLKPLNELPSPISEGTFGFHSLEQIGKLPTPASDKSILWPTFQQNRNGFTGIRIEYSQDPEPSFKASIETQIVLGS